MKLQNLSLHLALFTIMVSGPLMGAWHPPVIFGLMLASFFSFGLLALYKAQHGHFLTTNRLVALPLLSVLFTFSMLIPIPTSLHALLSPDSSRDLATAYGLLGQSPQALFLSLAPDRTATRLMQLLTALAIFLVVSDRAQHDRAQKQIFNWILFGAVTFFLLSLHHKLLDNHNHVARIFGIFSLLCALEFQESKPSRRQVAFGIMAIVCGVMVYATPSRWGMISFSICLLFFLKSWRIGLSILAAGFLIASGIVWDRLSTLAHPETYFGKIELFKAVPGLLYRHWLSGIGQGALSIEFHKNLIPNFDSDPLFSTAYIITYLENTTLQTLIDHGLIKGLILVSVALWSLTIVSKTRPRLLPVFLFVWIADFSDFAFESGTVLYLCALALALCPTDLKVKLSPTKQTGAFACLLGLGTLVAPLVFKQSHLNYLNAYHAYAESKVDPSHADAWLNYAVLRRPVLVEAHLVLARSHRRLRNYAQAIKEYRLAAASSPGHLRTILEEAAPISLNHRALLPSNSNEALKIWLQFALDHQNPQEALNALRALTHDKQPEDGQTALWFAQILTLQQGLPQTIDQTADWDQGLENPCPFLTWRLQGLQTVGKPAQALRELDHIKECLDNWELTKVGLYEQNKEPAKAKELVRALLRAHPDDPALLSRLP